MKKPSRPKTKTSLTISSDLWSRFRIQCLHEGRPAFTVVAELLEQYLARKKGGR